MKISCNHDIVDVTRINQSISTGKTTTMIEFVIWYHNVGKKIILNTNTIIIVA